jgi:apolipoprotein N-acyltransferase
MGASTSTAVYNSASLMAPDGHWVTRYDKIHLVPFGEYLPFKSLFGFAGGLTKEVGAYERGASRDPLPAGDEKLGVFICYESVFPHEVREFARDGAQVFINISDDGWYGEHGAFAQHLIQARMRAVENRRWLLRATDTGVTAAVDPFGRVTATVPREVRTVLTADYGLMNGTTFYTRHGDWFAYACAIISVVAVMWRLRAPAREKV